MKHKPHIRAQRLNRISQKMKSINIYTKEGLLIGEGAEIKIDSEKFIDFFTDIAKGLFYSASVIDLDWEEWEIKCQFDSYTYGKHWDKNSFLLAHKVNQIKECWGNSICYAGFIKNSKRLGMVSGWSISIYDEYLAYVYFKKQNK